MLEKIEVNKEYIDSDGRKVLVLAAGSDKVFVRTEKTGEYTQGIAFAKACWSEIPKPKKRYWLWDVESSAGEIFKSSTYMDEDGRTTSYRLSFSKETLIKKHENEFVEV